jgi:hypothetical protein
MPRASIPSTGEKFPDMRHTGDTAFPMGKVAAQRTFGRQNKR